VASLPLAARGACLDANHGFEALDRDTYYLGWLAREEREQATVNLCSPWAEFRQELRRLEERLLADLPLDGLPPAFLHRLGQR
jgi:hypothetical protein